jgi:D-alanine transaminase
MPRISYVNGRYLPHDAAAVHIEDRGLQFADSVYEVVALINGHLADEKGHLDRLERSMNELRIAPPMGRAALRLAMRELVRRNKIDNAGLYIQVTRGVAARDFAFPKDTPSSIIMTLRHANYDLAARKNGMKKIVTVPDIRWLRRDIKSTALLAQVLARQIAVDEGAHDAWMFDDKGFVTEGAASNAWIIDAKKNLITRPAKGNTILKGVTRSALQELCKKQGVKFIERSFTIKEACAAKEAFSSSAVALIAPVSHIDGKMIGNGKIGPVTEALFDLYMDYAHNAKARQFTWDPK